jgi:hypothetical protein
MSDDAEHSEDRDALRRRRRARAEAAQYDVGYAKPPEDGKFKEGHQRSRGPRTRKAPISSLDRYAAIGEQKMAIISDGRKLMLSRAAVIDLSTYSDAAKGKPDARRIHYQKQREIDALRLHSLEKHDTEDSNLGYLLAKIDEMAQRRRENENDPALREFINPAKGEGPQPNIQKDSSEPRDA